MILEHEIPQGGKVYFGKSAKLKREFENNICKIFYSNGFEEILTPAFSFLQHQRDFSDRKIIRITSQNNQQIALRCDSTIDTIRIITKRLARSTGAKKWFYIQPVFSYPSNEIHQIGAECLSIKEFDNLLKIGIECITQLQIPSILQLSNIKIPMLCAKELKIDIKNLLSEEINTLLQYEFLAKLIAIQTIDDLKHFIPQAPAFLKNELEKLLAIAQKCNHNNIIITTIQEAPVNYYNDIIFRIFINNSTLLLGGKYKITNEASCGFGIYTDNIIDILQNKE